MLLQLVGVGAPRALPANHHGGSGMSPDRRRLEET
jgi:hypothetical protein